MFVGLFCALGHTGPWVALPLTGISHPINGGKENEMERDQREKEEKKALKAAQCGTWRDI